MSALPDFRLNPVHTVRLTTCEICQRSFPYGDLDPVTPPASLGAMGGTHSVPRVCNPCYRRLSPADESIARNGRFQIFARRGIVAG